MKNPRAKVPWTPEQDAAIIELRAHRVPWEAIAAQVGRTLEACCARYRAIVPPSSRNQYISSRSWTKAEEAELRRMVDEDKPTAEIASALGRTISMVHSKLYYEQRHHRRIHGETYSRIKAPADREADRNRRMAAEMDLTAILCGDPRPGQSALDKKMGIFA